MKTTFTLSGLHCVGCSLLVEGELEDIGVTAKVHYAKQLIECTYDEKKITRADIVKIIEKCGLRVE